MTNPVQGPLTVEAAVAAVQVAVAAAEAAADVTLAAVLAGPDTVPVPVESMPASPPVNTAGGLVAQNVTLPQVGT
jgi:hypothetical protein